MKQTGQKKLYQQQIDTLLLNNQVPSKPGECYAKFIVQAEQNPKDSTRVIAMFDQMLRQRSR